jgi:hypothetical protein
VLRLVLACLAFGAAAAHGAYPLITEDTGTQGRGGWQLEGTSEIESDRGTDAHLVSENLVLNYGVTDSADLQLVMPWYSGTSEGVGDPQVNLKWRFFERGPFTLGMKPGILLPAGDAQKGNGTGKANWGLTLIAGYEAGALALHGDVRYQRNRNTVGERESISHVSAGVQYRLGRARLVADITREAAADPAFDEAARYSVLGVIWSVRPGFGVGVGWKKGSGGTTFEHAWLVGAGVAW